MYWVEMDVEEGRDQRDRMRKTLSLAEGLKEAVFTHSKNLFSLSLPNLQDFHHDEWLMTSISTMIFSAVSDATFLCTSATENTQDESHDSHL